MAKTPVRVIATALLLGLFLLSVFLWSPWRAPFHPSNALATDATSGASVPAMASVPRQDSSVTPTRMGDRPIEAPMPSVASLRAMAERGEASAVMVAFDEESRCHYFWPGEDFQRVNMPAPPPGSDVSAIWSALRDSERARCARYRVEGSNFPLSFGTAAALEAAMASDPELRRLLMPSEEDPPSLSDFLDRAADRANNPLEVQALLQEGVARRGRVMDLPGARPLLGGQRFRPERRDALAGYAATLVACRRGAPCGSAQALQINACLREYNCAPELPVDRFIRERLLLPGERETVDQLALLMEQALRVRGG